jgi:hypothetical protein
MGCQCGTGTLWVEGVIIVSIVGLWMDFATTQAIQSRSIPLRSQSLSLGLGFLKYPRGFAYIRRALQLATCSENWFSFWGEQTARTYT